MRGRARAGEGASIGRARPWFGYPVEDRTTHDASSVRVGFRARDRGKDRIVRQRPTFENVTERLRASLWFTPALLVTCSVAALFLLLRLDARVDSPPSLLAFSGDPQSARDVASTIAGAMMGFIGVVFSITIVALQLASSQFSPRALRGFLRDRMTKVTLGAFVSTLVYALLTMRHVDGADVVVPDLTVTGLFALTFTSIVLFIAYIDHVAHSIRAVNVIETIAGELRRSILDTRELLEHEPTDVPLHDPFEADGVEVHHDGAGGVLVNVDRGELAAAGRGCGGVVELVVRPGAFVRSGALVGRVHGATGEVNGSAVRQALSFDVERTMQDDVAFGLRQLVDIALRALSPGVNDPTTANQAIDRIHDGLGLLAQRRDADPWVRDSSGAPRAWVSTVGWDELVALALDELRLAGAGSLQVHRRLLAMLDDLIEHAPAARRPPLQLRRDEIVASADTAFDTELDRTSARQPDLLGIG